MLPIKHWTTTTQTPVYFVRTPTLPILELRIIFDAGSARDGKNPGIAELTHNLLREGTAKLSAEKVSDQFDNVGAIFTTFNDQDMAIIRLRTLTHDHFITSALKTLTTLLNAPAFSKTGFVRQQKLLLSYLKHQEQSPNDIAENAFFAALYPHHPYETPIMGIKANVLKITPAQIAHFYQKYYTAQNARIVMVGDLTQEKAEKIANQLSQKLPQGKRAKKLSMATNTTPAKIENILYQSTQTHVFMGQVGINHTDSRYFPFYVGNYMLGGDPLISQLGQSVREKKGFVYDIHSYFLPLAYKGPFLINFQTHHQKVQLALNTVQKTLADFMTKKSLEVALKVAKNHLIKGYSLQFDSNNAIAGHLVELAFYDLPLDYFDTFMQKIAAVTLEQVRNAFKMLVQPDKMLVVAVGNPK